MVGKALRLLPRSNKPRHAGNWPEGDKILRLSCVLKTYFLLLQTKRDLCVPSLIEKALRGRSIWRHPQEKSSSPPMDASAVTMKDSTTAHRDCSKRVACGTA